MSVWLKSLGTRPADERPRLGQLANATKDHIDGVLTERIEAAAPGASAQGRASTSRFPAARRRSATAIR